ncbi:hypothetical protein [Methanimicrococcus blatticola]|uniref:hypothetical protein n=1 Tax=Methanimicrococcus blatticola TaxID=91560 RepID=UPI00105CE735|nr:hypothetical protein [Methanimicrococcus blatticola]MBZ3934855.1 hypothetical protein [Methanimicrococcus blatticola]MCC2509047.1 hypothetical protein [Methanimicrococcus blatticola]
MLAVLLSALLPASASFYDSRSLRERGYCYLPFALLCYLPLALLLLPAVCVAAVTYRLRCCCYLPFALLLLPSVRVVAAACRSHCCCSVLSPSPPYTRVATSLIFTKNSLCFFKNIHLMYFVFQKNSKK